MSIKRDVAIEPAADIREADEIELQIIADKTAEGKLADDWFPVMTYELVQTGYPTPDRGMMVARPFYGTDIENRLMSGRGEWCKVSDVQKLRAGAQSLSRTEIVQRLEKLKSAAAIEDDPYGCTPTWNAALDKAIEVLSSSRKQSVNTET